MTCGSTVYNCLLMRFHITWAGKNKPWPNVTCYMAVSAKKMLADQLVGQINHNDCSLSDKSSGKL